MLYSLISIYLFCHITMLRMMSVYVVLSCHEICNNKK